MVGAFACPVRNSLFIASVFLLSLSFAEAQAPKPAGKGIAPQAIQAAPVRGKALFSRDCAFCHGRDAAGGETGPDLTRSRLVKRDPRGDQIRALLQNGRVEKGMPAFPKLLPTQVSDLIAFIRDQTNKANAKPGDRRGVDVADLQTGDAEAGKAYFNGPGKCSTCHSPTGDLAGIATRHLGLELEMRMLNPEYAKPKLTVKTARGDTFTGTLVHQDEFALALIDGDGWYRSWPIHDVQYQIDMPMKAHVEQLEKYSDQDIHNLMAYLQTLQ